MLSQGQGAGGTSSQRNQQSLGCSLTLAGRGGGLLAACLGLVHLGA